MAYDEHLAKRVRQKFADLPNVEEKEMMGGLTFMYNNKMCVGIIKNELMCRIDPALHNMVIEKTGCRTMDFTKGPMKGFIMVNEIGMKQEDELNYYLELALNFNKKAKASKKNQQK
jgi:TfoX/Sxy family transcriptional regulator of competence genes